MSDVYNFMYIHDVGAMIKIFQERKGGTIGNKK